MQNAAVLPSPSAFSFAFLKGNDAADTMDASFAMEDERKPTVLNDITSNCCGCREN